MLIGYKSAKWQKIATHQKEAVRALSRGSANLVLKRLSQLAAFENLGQIRCQAAPLYLRVLVRETNRREDRHWEFAIRLHGGDAILLRPAGEFLKLADGAPDAGSVTQVEIVFIGNHRGKQ
jgi:hypothetical protein